MAPQDIPADPIDSPSGGLPLDPADVAWSASIDELRRFMIENSWIEPAIERGLGALVEDEEGKQYLDLEGGPAWSRSDIVTQAL